MKAICNHKKQFIYILQMYGVSASGCFVFELCDFRQSKFGRCGFLAPGLVLFRDDTYNIIFFVTTLYPDKAKDTKQDRYNSYCLHLRITIKCTFGWLNQRSDIRNSVIPAENTP